MATHLKDTDMATIRTNPFAGKTSKVARPTTDQPAYQFGRPDRLARAQRQWDQADQWRKDREAALAESRTRQEAEDRAKAERAAGAARERAEAEDAKIVADLRRQFFAAEPLASEDAFQKALPSLREDRTRRLIGGQATADDEAKRAQRRMYAEF